LYSDTRTSKRCRSADVAPQPQCTSTTSCPRTKLVHPSPGATSRLSIDLCAGEDPVDRPLCQQSALTGTDHQGWRTSPKRRRQDSRSQRNHGTCRCQVSWWTWGIGPTISCWFALIYRVSMNTNKKYLHLRQQASVSLVVKARNSPAVGRRFETSRAHDFLPKKEKQNILQHHIITWDRTATSSTPHHHVGPPPRPAMPCTATSTMCVPLLRPHRHVVNVGPTGRCITLTKINRWQFSSSRRCTRRSILLMTMLFSISMMRFWLSSLFFYALAASHFSNDEARKFVIDKAFSVTNNITVTR
jgi:hypothetical protein